MSHLIYEGCMVGCDFKSGHQKRDWITCLNFVNHSRSNSEHNWGDLARYVTSQQLKESSL